VGAPLFRVGCWWLCDVSPHPIRPLDAQPVPGQRQRPGIQTARIVPNLSTTEIAITGWQASATDFRKHRSHIIRTGTANTPPTHQTALGYETAAPDGGRLAPKNAPRERESPSPSLRRSPRTTGAILAEASESAPGLWDDPIDDPGLERFCPIVRDKCS